MRDRARWRKSILAAVDRRQLEGQVTAGETAGPPLAELGGAALSACHSCQRARVDHMSIWAQRAAGGSGCEAPRCARPWEISVLAMGAREGHLTFANRWTCRSARTAALEEAPC